MYCMAKAVVYNCKQCGLQKYEGVFRSGAKFYKCIIPRVCHFLHHNRGYIITIDVCHRTQKTKL